MKSEPQDVPLNGEIEEFDDPLITENLKEVKIKNFKMMMLKENFFFVFNRL